MSVRVHHGTQQDDIASLPLVGDGDEALPAFEPDEQVDLPIPGLGTQLVLDLRTHAPIATRRVLRDHRAAINR